MSTLTALSNTPVTAPNYIPAPSAAIPAVTPTTETSSTTAHKTTPVTPTPPTADTSTPNNTIYSTVANVSASTIRGSNVDIVT